jgi:hypothetical protein
MRYQKHFERVLERAVGGHAVGILQYWGNLDTPTTPLPTRYTYTVYNTTRYTSTRYISMRHTSTKPR